MGRVKMWVLAHVNGNHNTSQDNRTQEANKQALTTTSNSQLSNTKMPTTTTAGSNDWDIVYKFDKCSLKTGSGDESCASIPINTTKPQSIISTTENNNIQVNTNAISSNEIQNCNNIKDKRSNDSSPCRLGFDFLRVIGTGSYGTVILSRSRENPEQLYAVKIILKSKLKADILEDEYQRLLTEKNILSSVNHPFITKLACAFETRESLNFVMEYCAGGDMYYLLEKCPQHRMNEQDVKFYSASIALALNYLHQQGILYRDLKPENLLIDAQGYLRLADFGFAKEHMNSCNTKCKTFCGSAEYVAPEVICGTGYGLAADLWSFGCVIYELLTGLPPFYCPNDRSELFDLITRSSPKYPSNFSKNVVDLLSGLLEKNPAKRLGNSDPNGNGNGMQDLFDHPFFSDVDWYLLGTKQMCPPIVPVLKGPSDTSNFEEQYTKQIVRGQVIYERNPQQTEPVEQHSSRLSKQSKCHYFNDFDWCDDRLSSAF